MTSNISDFTWEFRDVLYIDFPYAGFRRIPDHRPGGVSINAGNLAMESDPCVDDSFYKR